MTFSILTAQRIVSVGQYDRIDNLIPCNLRGDKCSVSRQFLVNEFYFSAVFECFDPLSVWHLLASSGGVSAHREYTFFSVRKRGWGTKTCFLEIRHSYILMKPHLRTNQNRHVTCRTAVLWFSCCLTSLNNLNCLVPQKHR